MAPLIPLTLLLFVNNEHGRDVKYACKSYVTSTLNLHVYTYCQGYKTCHLSGQFAGPMVPRDLSLHGLPTHE
jgi:hypothetical protein